MSDLQAPDGFVLRATTLQDAAALAQLFSATAELDGVSDSVTEGEMMERLTQPHSDVTQDRWVVAEPGNPAQLIASGTAQKSPLTDSGIIFALTHPHWRNRGLGSAMVARALARAHEQGAVSTRSWVDAALPDAVRFAERRGFQRTGFSVEMRAPATVELPQPVWPQGYTVRTYAEVQQPEVLFEADNRGFIGHHDYHGVTMEQITHSLSAEGVAEEGIFLAFGPAGDVAGLCWTIVEAARSARRGTPTGFIASLGVVPEHRRKGLGRALLLTGMRWLRANGSGPIELDAWGGNEQALPLYRDVGFEIYRETGEYRRELRNA